jgi:hypothetical protein
MLDVPSIAIRQALFGSHSLTLDGICAGLPVGSLAGLEYASFLSRRLSRPVLPIVRRQNK